MITPSCSSFSILADTDGDDKNTCAAISLSGVRAFFCRICIIFLSTLLQFLFSPIMHTPISNSTNIDNVYISLRHLFSKLFYLYFLLSLFSLYILEYFTKSLNNGCGLFGLDFSSG